MTAGVPNRSKFERSCPLRVPQVPDNPGESILKSSSFWPLPAWMATKAPTSPVVPGLKVHVPDWAPLTVENFVQLAQRRFFDGVVIHRVVPNFVLQDGDPTGTGNGGPGYEIRDEINPLEYARGTVGMALSAPVA